MKHYTLHFAQAYGAGTYGDGTYSCTTQQQTAGTCTASSGTTTTTSGGLANTGIAIMAIVTLACLIIFVALAVRIWRRKPTPVLQEQEAAEQSDTDETPRQD